MRAHDPTPNILGRLTFLRASETYWTEPLDALLETKVALPDFGNREPLTVSQLSRRPGGKEVGHAIETWAERQRIRDPWMRDAALQTLIQRRETGARIWYYHCAEMRPKGFTLRLPPWTPLSILTARDNTLSWSTFQRNANRTFRAQLKDYKTRSHQIFGGNRPYLAMHAIWTALWQRGKTAGQIQLWLSRTYKRKVTATNIQMRVREFADDIRLTLRENRSGPART